MKYHALSEYRYCQAYGEKLFELAAYYSAQNYTEFAAVVQPGFIDQSGDDLLLACYITSLSLILQCYVFRQALWSSRPHTSSF